MRDVIFSCNKGNMEKKDLFCKKLNQTYLYGYFDEIVKTLIKFLSRKKGWKRKNLI